MLRTVIAAAGASLAALIPTAQGQIPGKPPSGQWSGIGFQVGPGGYQSQWTVTVQLRGEQTSSIAYPSLGCLAELKPVAVRAWEAEYIETITEGDCITGGRVLVREVDGKLYWSWIDPGDVGADASAVLYPNELLS